MLELGAFRPGGCIKEDVSFSVLSVKHGYLIGEVDGFTRA